MSAELSIAIKLGASVGGAVAAIRSVLGGTRDLGRTTQILRREYQSLGQDIRQMSANGSSDLQHLQRQHLALGRSLNDLRRRTVIQNGYTTRLDNARQYREQLRSEALGAFAGVGAVLVPVKAAMNFESSMADMRKVVDFDTPQQLKQMEQNLLNMTHRIPMAGRELAAIAASGGQLGIARQDIAGFTETIAKMSVAFDMSAEQAGDSMAKLANVYQIPIARIGELGDAINHLSNNSPAKASDIVNALGRVGGVAKQFGLSELQTASLANAFISLGKTPEIAGTAINGMLTRLMTADKQGGKFQATLQAMGISAQQLKRDIAQNGEQALMDFLQRINQLPKDRQMGALVDLFGLEYADDVAVLAGSLDTYRQSIDALKQTDASGSLKFLGSMEKEFAARSATTANNWQLFKNQMAHLAINIGSVMLPAINDLLHSLKPLIEQFIQFAQAHPTLIKNIFLALTALVAFKAGGLAVRFAFSSLLSVFWRGSSIVSGFFAVWSRGAAAFRLFQIGRTISALRMFGLTARQAKIWLSGLKAIGSVFTWIVGMGSRLMTFLPMLGQAFMVLGRFLLMTPIGLALGLMATAAYLLYTRWQDVVGGAKLLWQDFSAFIGHIANTIMGLFSIVGWVLAQIKTAFNNGLTGILALIVNWSPIGAFYSAFAAVMSWFGITLPAQFTGFGGMLIDGLIKGIRAKIGAAVQTIQGLAARVKGAFTGSGKGMDIHSPSRVFRAYGGFMTEGLAIGVNKGADKPIGKIRQLASNLKNRFAERMGGFRSDVSARLSVNAENLSQARAEYSQARAEYSQAQVNHGGAMTIHFNPTINVAGGDIGQIETALQMGLRDFEDLFKRMMADRERRAY